MRINDPAIVQEVETQFFRYEKALMENDVGTLNELFWHSCETIRFGPAETLYGIDEIAGYRAQRDVTDIDRDLTHTVITAYGADFATAFAEYRRKKSGRIGRQSQTWMRTEEGWRIVAAHVSLLPADA